MSQRRSRRWHNAITQQHSFERGVALGQLCDGLSQDLFSFLSPFAKEPAGPGIGGRRRRVSARWRRHLTGRRRLLDKMGLVAFAPLRTALTRVSALALTLALTGIAALAVRKIRRVRGHCPCKPVCHVRSIGLKRNVARPRVGMARVPVARVGVSHVRSTRCS